MIESIDLKKLFSDLNKKIKKLGNVIVMVNYPSNMQTPGMSLYWYR